MNNVKIIVDPGSTHMGKIEYCYEHIDNAAKYGADAVKFQLFEPDNLFTSGNGNIPLPSDYLFDLIQYGERRDMEVFASVFDTTSYYALGDAGAKSIKFAYSQRFSHLLDWAIDSKFQDIYVSYGVMDEIERDSPRLTKLYCIDRKSVL